MSLVLIDCEITGHTPLLCNKFSDAFMAGDTGGKALIGDKGTPMEQAKAKVYIGTTARR
jgi:hypothetical protein